MDLPTCCGLFQKGHGNQGPDSDRLALDSSDHVTESGDLSLVIIVVVVLILFVR